MRLYLVIPSVLVASLFVASGVAAITRGWVPPWNRRSVRRVRVYGWGQLVVAFALCLQGVLVLVSSDTDIRLLSFGPLMLTGIIVMMVGQYTGRNRQGSGTR
ncbi:hypothetical protein ACFY3J_18400 [Streptomyces sp. NPDC001231]|uniref:hypothetical protein n=1 Tax=Streptomyces sp. NPDC001231 TaxID=3364549 RepID=UPI0036B91E90